MTDEKKQDVDVLKSIIHEVATDIKLGIEIGEGGITKEDLKYIPKVQERVKAIIELAKKIKEAEEEIKDIDASEAVELIVATWDEIK